MPTKHWPPTSRGSLQSNIEQDSNLEQFPELVYPETIPPPGCECPAFFFLLYTFRGPGS